MSKFGQNSWINKTFWFSLSLFFALVEFGRCGNTSLPQVIIGNSKNARQISYWKCAMLAVIAKRGEKKYVHTTTCDAVSHVELGGGSVNKSWLHESFLFAWEVCLKTLLHPTSFTLAKTATFPLLSIKLHLISLEITGNGGAAAIIITTTTAGNKGQNYENGA